MAQDDMVNTTSIPLPTDNQLLRSIREDLVTRVAPELSSDMAKAVCRMAADLIDRMVVRRTDWPGLLYQQIVRRAAILRDTAALLARAGALDSTDKADASTLDRAVPDSQAGLEALEAFNRRQAQLLGRLIPRMMDVAAARPEATAEAKRLTDALVAAEEASEQGAVEAGKRNAARFSEERAASEAEVTLAQLQIYLRDRFPERTSLTVTSMRELAGGFGKTTILFDVEGLYDLPASLVIRRDRSAGATEATVIEEFPLLQAVQGYGLPAPEPLWLESDPSRLGLPFIVVRRLPGRPAGTLWAPDPTLCTAETALDLARIIARLHAIPVDTVGSTGIWAPEAISDATQQSIDYITDLWRRTQVEPDPVMDMCLRWLALNQPPPPERIVLVHSDIGFHNLLVEDERISGLLDWELAHPGDPNEDLCYVRPYVEKLLPWADFVAEYRAHGGCEYLEDRTTYYTIWREVRNTVFTALCHKGFCSDANTDIRFGHTGMVYYRMMTLDAARKIAAL